MSSSDETTSSSDEQKASVIRLSLRELDQKCYTQKKNDFLKAWKLIQELPPTNPNSFWSIATYHGMPFKSRRDKDSSSTAKDEDKDQEKTWGGYCQHGNVLFPFWHRFYCLRLEQALQSVLERGKERVALHYWDATSEESMKEGLPDIVMAKTVCIDKEEVPNPLFKFKLPRAIKDNVSTTDEDGQFYEKVAGYETCRYPYSGIRSPLHAKEIAITHNEVINRENEDPEILLQTNIIAWLKMGGRGRPGVAKQFEDCLETKNYNPFSNTSSVVCPDVSLEQPHNDLHLAIGGYTAPPTNEDGSVKVDDQGNICWDSLIEGANGDMGANEVAAYDPVFFLHHCNIDRMLWVWQKKHGKTDPETFTIDNSNKEDKGISNSSHGAAPNQEWGQMLNEKTILYPFQDEYGVPRKAKDCINIVSQLDYNYSIGSLDQHTWPEPHKVKIFSLLDEPSTSWEDINQKLGKEINDASSTHHRCRIIFDRTYLGSPLRLYLRSWGSWRSFKSENFVQVKDVNKDKISGSFLVQVFNKANGKLYYLGQRGVLSRWNRGICANCQGRRMAHISIPIPRYGLVQYDPENLEVHLVHKDGFTGKYKSKVYAGKDLVEPTAARRASGEQEPSLRIVEACVLK